MPIGWNPETTESLPRVGVNSFRSDLWPSKGSQHICRTIGICSKSHEDPWISASMEDAPKSIRPPGQITACNGLKCASDVSDRQLTGSQCRVEEMPQNNNISNQIYADYSRTNQQDSYSDREAFRPSTLFLHHVSPYGPSFHRTSSQERTKYPDVALLSVETRMPQVTSSMLCHSFLTVNQAPHDLHQNRELGVSPDVLEPSSAQSITASDQRQTMFSFRQR